MDERDSTFLIKRLQETASQIDFQGVTENPKDNQRAARKALSLLYRLRSLLTPVKRNQFSIWRVNQHYLKPYSQLIYEIDYYRQKYSTLPMVDVAINQLELLTNFEGTPHA